MLVVLCGGLVVFCGGLQSGAPNVDVRIDCTAEAVLGSGAIDTKFPSVGVVNGCTATLITPDAVLLAAHCFDEYARGCRTKAQTLREMHFTLSPSGCRESVHRAGVDCEGEQHTYELADVALHPGAYDRNACAGASCSSASEASVYAGLVPVFDVALVRLVHPVDPSRGATPLAVVTSITDDEDDPFAVHRRVDVQRFQAPIGCARPQAFVVGWGANDLDAPVRIAGRVDLLDGPGWDQVCLPPNSCVAMASASSACPPDADSSTLQVQGLRTQRRSSSPGAFDGEITWLGDSGSPLLVRGGASVGAVPELDEGFFVVGVLSGGTLPPLPVEVGQDIEDVYAATFEPSNARFIEETLRAFASAPPDPATLGDVTYDAGAETGPVRGAQGTASR